jgi:PiT family inorganic phosphate transporter
MPPAWVIWSCYIAIGLGTMFGGWRIVKTMGQRITKLKPVGGFCAETGGADHAVPRHRPGRAGVDHAHHHRRHLRRRVGAQRVGVRWGLAGNIVLAWIVTIPATAFIAAVFYGVSLLLF